MKQRYLYALIFCIPAFLIALLISALFGGATAGFLWIYVFGDSAWPQGVDIILSALFILFFFTVWIVLVACAYKVGKAQESQTETSSKQAIFAAIGVTALLVLIIGIHQRRIGNIGPKSNSSACANYCLDSGDNASMISTTGDCNCLGAQGQAKVKTSMAALRAKGY